VPTLLRYLRFPPGKYPHPNVPEIPSYLFPPGGTKKARKLAQGAFCWAEGMATGCPQAGYLGNRSAEIPVLLRMCLNTRTCLAYLCAGPSTARVFWGRRGSQIRRPRPRKSHLRACPAATAFFCSPHRRHGGAVVQAVAGASVSGVSQVSGLT
jgi:hypothetical protein